MSANGIVHVLESGETEQMTLDRWAKEESLYKSIRKLRTFNQYLMWKPLRVWRNFVMRQRYQQIYTSIVNYPLYYSLSFASASVAVSSLMNTFEEIILRSLLCFFPQRKYKIKEFISLAKSNLDVLNQEYSDFFAEAVGLVQELFGMLSDPELLIVKDEEFEEIRRKNPNIQQLIVLERKKEAEKIRRTEQMADELKNMTNFLRMLDYMLLETLRKASYDCWEIAYENIFTDLSSIWQVDVYFSEDGKVAFEPSEETLVQAVKNAFSDARSTMDSLPRLLRSTDLRNVLRKSGINLGNLFDLGPAFHDIINCISFQDQIEARIISHIEESFHLAFSQSRSFEEYFSLFQLGQTWNVHNYLKTRNGEPYTGNLSHSSDPSGNVENFINNPKDQPIIDFQQMRDLITRLKSEEGRVGAIRAGLSVGVLHIDSRTIKAILTPIPMNSLHETSEMLKELMQYKIDLIGGVFKEYSLKLKVEPSNLEEYVDFCDLLKKTIIVTPQIQIEITFIDDLLDLFDDYSLGSLKIQCKNNLVDLKV